MPNMKPIKGSWQPKASSAICYQCKQDALKYAPGDHEEYPWLCAHCGARWGAETHWWEEVATRGFIREFIKYNWPALLGVVGGIISLFFLPAMVGILMIFFGGMHWITHHPVCF